MDLHIREYTRDDLHDLIDKINQFQDFFCGIDTLKLFCARTETFGESYAKELLKRIEKNDGRIYVAVVRGEMVGFVAGILEKSSPTDILEYGAQLYGKTLELFVEETYRGQGIGKKLLSTLEKYFAEKQCTKLLIEVFAPNAYAHGLYKRLGYQDVGIEMIKDI